MKVIQELQKCPQVVSVERVSIAVDSLPERLQLEAVEKSAQVTLLRLVYRAKKLKVVGYVVVPKRRKNLPVIMHLRGGGRDFSMLTNKSLYLHLVRFAAEGYVVVAPQYPGVEGGEGSDCFGSAADMASITVWKKIIDYIPQTDPERIGAKGYSRGGLMVYMLLREVSWLRAGVIGGAPTDQIRLGSSRPGWRKYQVSLWGTAKEEMIRRSPLRWAADLPTNVPLLIVHGSSDWRVPAEHGLKMSHELYKRKLPHRFILFEGADHGLTNFRLRLHHETLEWLNHYVRDEAPVPSMEPYGE